MSAIIESEDYEDKYPLHEACKMCLVEDVREMVKSVDVNRKDDEGDTPLHKSAMYDTDTTIMKLLIEHGADVNATNDFQETPLHSAIGYMELINEDVNIIMRTRRGIFDLLIDNGANVNARNAEGMTPLHYICKVNVWKYILYFIDKGADLNVKDNEGNTALQYFKDANGSKRRVKYLQNLGAE
jgi:ankyrin repeat protein